MLQPCQKRKATRIGKSAQGILYEPKPLVLAKRFHFYKQGQAAGESLADYQAELRCLARTCDFDSFLSEALCDRFVVEMKSESIQKRLLSEDKLTLAKALEIGQGMEAAAREFKEPASSLVMQVYTPKRKHCHRCGRNNHDQKDCKFCEAKCHNCGKTGHIAPAVKPAVQLLQIQEVHPVAHSNACNFCSSLSIFLLVLSRPSFTSRTPNKDKKTEQLFYFLRVQVL